MIYLFDIDGTLMLSGGAGSRALDRVFAARHGLTGALDAIDAGGKTDPQILGEVFAAHLGRAPSEDELAAIIADYLPLLVEELARSSLRLMPWVHQALDWLDRRGEVHLGLATGNVRAGAMAKLGRAALWERFAFGGFGCDAAVRAEVVRAGIDRGRAHAGGAGGGGAAIDDADIVVIGDTLHDITAARACGIRVLAVATGSVDRATLASAEPDAVFDSLEELPAWHCAQYGS
jgi:phosphoglycolate phosphatase